MNLRWTKRRVLWVGGALLIAGGVLLAVFLPSAREPVYQGRGLGEWIDLARGSPQFAPTSAWSSVQAIGAQGLPWLMAELGTQKAAPQKAFLRELMGMAPQNPEARWARARMGLVLLGDTALPMIPELVASLSDSNRSVSARFALDVIALGVKSPSVYPYPGLTNVIPPASSNAHAAVLEAYLVAVRGTSEWAKVESLYALGMYSEDAARILPAVLPCTRDNSAMVRGAAAWALGKFAREPVPVIPELIRLLDDPVAAVRRNAAFALGQYYRQARTAVPRLLEARRDPDPEVRKVANESLDKIDPETAAAIPDLPAFKP